MRALALAVAALLVVAAVPAAAHVNHVSADPQVSADGEVVIETTYIAVDGWIVLHEVDEGGPGAPLGETFLTAGFHTDVTVAVENWTAWSGTSVYAVLHQDDGDREFAVEQDGPIRSFGSRAGTRFALDRGDTAFVTARGFSAQTTGNGTVTVRRVAMPADGRLVVRHDGERVGARSLSAGHHGNATVTLDRAFSRRQNGSFTLRAQLWTGGDVVTASGSNVSTTFGVVPTGNTTTPTDDGPDIVTPSPNGDEAAQPTAEPTPTATAGSGPGPGAAGALVAVALALVALSGRKRI